MYTVSLNLYKHTILDGPELLEDIGQIKRLVNMPRNRGYLGLGFTGDRGVVLDTKGRYYNVPAGYYVSYWEEPVNFDEDICQPGIPIAPTGSASALRDSLGEGEDPFSDSDGCPVCNSTVSEIGDSDEYACDYCSWDSRT